jgi:hypothetical protein
VEVEPWVLPTGAGAKVGGKPTTTANTCADAATDVGEAGRWGHDDTPFGTSSEHYRMELLHPSSSLPPCGHESHPPR